MEIHINGEKIDARIEDEKTVGDILKAFEIDCQKQDAAVVGILIDGKKITAENFDEEAKHELSGNEKFEFDVVTKNSLKEEFKGLSIVFRELSKKMENVPLALQTGKDNEANGDIKILANAVENFCHTATFASLFEEFSLIRVEEKPLSEFFADFSPILEDFEEALKTGDTVGIGDLAEYEICPRLKSLADALEEIK